MQENGETIVIRLDRNGEIAGITLGKDELKPTDLEELPAGRVIPGSRLGKIYTFESNPSRRRCVKRFGKWW